MGSEVEREFDDRWWLGLRGTVTESTDVAEYSAVIRFGSVASLTVESVAYLDTLGRETAKVGSDAAGTFVVSDEFKSLARQRVLSAVAFKTGDLRIVFESGAILRVPSAEHYEAWQLTGPSGRLWVSLPGGGLATFPAAAST